MSLWQRIAQYSQPAAGRAAREGGIRISREMAYGVAPFLEANSSPELGDPSAQLQELHRLLYDTRRDMIAPSLATSDLFLVAVCDMAYLGGSVLVRRNGHALLEMLSAAAGVERQSLELLLLPSCGLGGDVRFIDSEGQAYSLALGSHHKALLRDERGRMRTGVPHGFSPEERGRLARYKALVNQKSLAQRRRLELAMLTGQRWDADLFAQMLAHPLLAHHARHLLWAGYDAAGNLIEGFLVQDDGALMTAAYGDADLARYAMVGIPHSADAPVDAVLAWSELMDDFHVAPLFLQLHRPVYRPADVVLALAASFASARWGASFLFMTLGHMGWDMLVPSQMFEYALPNMPVSAVLDLRVEGIAARPLGLRFERDGIAVPQEEIPPSLASEVCWHMARLAANPNLIVP